MRMRNLKNTKEILENCSFLITNPLEKKGSWQDAFVKKQPIYLEIGMGKGQFLYQNALSHQDINFIGIEKFDNVLAKAILKMEELPNLRVIRFDAEQIDQVFSKEIDLLYLNFSDPWPKKRHWSRRLTSPLFLEKYEGIFQGEKKIEMRSDNVPLFTYSIEMLSQKGYGLSEVSFDYHKEKEDLIMSEYEQKFSRQGDKIYHLFARK